MRKETCGGNSGDCLQRQTETAEHPNTYNRVQSRCVHNSEQGSNSCGSHSICNKAATVATAEQQKTGKATANASVTTYCNDDNNSIWKSSGIGKSKSSNSSSRSAHQHQRRVATVATAAMLARFRYFEPHL